MCLFRRRRKKKNEYLFKEMKIGHPVMLIEVNAIEGSKVRVGFLESIKDDKLTARIPSLGKSVEAIFMNNNWYIQ